MLSKLGNMDLVARCAVEGSFTGLHPSPFHGFSVEYSDHRDYQPGDYLRNIHWRNSARRGKLMVKELDRPPQGEVYVAFSPRIDRIALVTLV